MAMNDDERRDIERLLAGGPGPDERDRMFAAIDAAIDQPTPAPRRRLPLFTGLSAVAASAAVVVLALRGQPTVTPTTTPTTTTPTTPTTTPSQRPEFVARGDARVVGEGDHQGTHVVVRCPASGCRSSSDVDIWLTPPPSGAMVHLLAVDDRGTATWLPTSSAPLTAPTHLAATLPAGHLRFYAAAGPTLTRDEARAAVEANIALQFTFDVAP